MLTIEQHCIPPGLQEFCTTVRRHFSFIHLITKGGLFGLLLSDSIRTVCSGRQASLNFISNKLSLHLSLSTLSWLPTALCFAARRFPKRLDDFKFYFTVGSFIPQRANSPASVGDHGNTFQSSFCW